MLLLRYITAEFDLINRDLYLSRIFLRRPFSVMSDTSIFSLRYGSNAKLNPPGDELAHFLNDNKEGTKEPHASDLAPYWQLLSGLADYKTQGGNSFQEKLFYSVLDLSQFAKPALKAAVELYKYHVHAFSKLDFRKPLSFIKSAEEEIARLNQKKKEEAARIDRLKGMVEERKHAVDDLRKRSGELTEELSNIIAYVGDNLTRIEKLSERSISVLVTEQVDRKVETSLIEDIKTEFKERLRDSLRQGTITKEELEQAKDQFSVLSEKITEVMRSDIYVLTQLYESIHGHAKKTVEALSIVSEKIAAKQHASYEEDVELYLQAEQVLVDLIRDFRFEAKTTDKSNETEHDRILNEKRRAILDHLIGLLKQA